MPFSTFTISPRTLDAPPQKASMFVPIKLLRKSSIALSIHYHPGLAKNTWPLPLSLLTFVAVSKSNLHQRYHSVISLLGPFELQQVIVGAARAARKFPTHFGPRVINRALPLYWIEKLTGFTKNWIGFPSQDLLALPRCG